jgi:hypothetical protein
MLLVCWLGNKDQQPLFTATRFGTLDECCAALVQIVAWLTRVDVVAVATTVRTTERELER